MIKYEKRSKYIVIKKEDVKKYLSNDDISNLVNILGKMYVIQMSHTPMLSIM